MTNNGASMPASRSSTASANALTAKPAAPANLWVTAIRSPRFQPRKGPKGSTISSGTMMMPKVKSKNGAPTEIVSPVSASSSSG